MILLCNGPPTALLPSLGAATRPLTPSPSFGAVPRPLTSPPSLGAVPRPLSVVAAPRNAWAAQLASSALCSCPASSSSASPSCCCAIWRFSTPSIGYIMIVCKMRWPLRYFAIQLVCIGWRGRGAIWRHLVRVCVWFANKTPQKSTRNPAQVVCFFFSAWADVYA